MLSFISKPTSPGEVEHETTAGPVVCALCGAHPAWHGVSAEGLGSLRDGAGGHCCHPRRACGCLQAAVALLWVRLSWDVKAVASRWGNIAAGHLSHLSESYSGHSKSRDCLTQGDLKLCLDPCLNTFQLCFRIIVLPLPCWHVFGLLPSCSELPLFIHWILLKPTLENLFALPFCSRHLATAVNDRPNSQCSGTEVRDSFEKPWEPQIVFKHLAGNKRVRNQTELPSLRVGAQQLFAMVGVTREPRSALVAFWFTLTPSIQINTINCRDSGRQTEFW